METKGRGRRPIGESRMTQADYSRRYREKMKRHGNPTGDELKAITHSALKAAWTQIPYITTGALYDAVRAEARCRGLDPEQAVMKFDEAMMR